MGAAFFFLGAAFFLVDFLAAFFLVVFLAAFFCEAAERRQVRQHSAGRGSQEIKKHIVLGGGAVLPW